MSVPKILTHTNIVIHANGCSRQFIACLLLLFFTGRMPRSGKLPVLNLLTGQKSGFSPRWGDSLHQFTSNLAWPTVTWVRLAVLPQLPQGVGMRPQNIKKFHFLVKSRPTGATPLTNF